MDVVVLHEQPILSLVDLIYEYANKGLKLLLVKPMVSDELMDLVYDLHDQG